MWDFYFDRAENVSAWLSLLLFFIFISSQFKLFFNKLLDRNKESKLYEKVELHDSRLIESNNSKTQITILLRYWTKLN